MKFLLEINKNLAMNIFILSWNIIQCVQWYFDRHCSKMILETAQLLCSVHHMTNTNNNYKPPYKLAHKNHPCSIWARESLSNYCWLLELGFAMSDEFTWRTGGKIHASLKVLEELEAIMPSIPDKGITQPPLCMPDQYKDSNNDVVKSYRQYYIHDKKPKMDKLPSFKWPNKRPSPDWLE